MAHLSYTPELNETRPEADGRATLSHYGRHYFIDTRLELKGRGITYMRTLTSQDLVPQAQHRVGEHEYKVTERAFEKLCEKYDFVSESRFD